MKYFIVALTLTVVFMLGTSPEIGIAAESNGSTPTRDLLLTNSQTSPRSASVRREGASSYKILVTFTGPNGSLPAAAPIAVNGFLYGTTQTGGLYHGGIIYKVSTSGVLTILHNFAGGGDGAYPVGTLLFVNGNLYGTTTIGGKGYGTIFEIGLSGGEHILHDFVNTDGSTPVGLAYANGLLYGTADSGGAYGQGTVFEMSTSGAGFRTLHNFNGQRIDGDGSLPFGDLVALNGYVYGTTALGGYIPNRTKGSVGTVFVVNPAGKLSILYDFIGLPGSAFPYSGLVSVNGTLYGTTVSGGNDYPPYFNNGAGTIYKITPSGIEHVAYNFGPPPPYGGDGASPGSGSGGSLTAIGTVLYGATTAGGTTASDFGEGTIFSFDTVSGIETVLHAFNDNGSVDGAIPESCGLAQINGTLYGTTAYGGTQDVGTIFAITP